MNIVTAKEMRSADEATFRELGVPSRAVMEGAGREVSAFILEALPEEATQGVLFVAGSGNNGGDAFVAARALFSMDLPVHVVLLKPIAELSGEARSAADAYVNAGGAVSEFESIEALLSLALRSGVLVDGIFGTGMRPPATGRSATLIDAVNRVAESAGLPIVAIDIPSGLSSDTGDVSGAAIRASHTLALQCLKVGHVTYPAADLCGSICVADIGIRMDIAGVPEITRELLTADRASAIARNLESVRSDAHKGTRGHVAVIGGSDGKLGAPKLTGSAALNAGAGLVTLVLPESLSRMLAPQLCELMAAPLADKGGQITAEGLKQLDAVLAGKRAVVLGPGLGQSPGAKQLVENTFRYCTEREIPVVIDADALNLIALHPELKKALPPQSVLTPHPGEMARLIGSTTDVIQSFRLSSAIRAAQELSSVVVLKGARTVIATPEGRTIINPAATSALGTGGSGDALGGIIGALIAQGAGVLDAALLGVFAHGAAGELLERRRGGMFGIVATDIIAAAAEVLNALQRQSVLSSNAVVKRVLPMSLGFIDSPDT
ncbi:MAG: NAD(P)H-hydrate dehydratase [Bdellovibrionota bacterium]